MRRPVVTPADLSYYRAHLRQAVREEGVVCLECGAVRRAIPQHAGVHGLTAAQYRARWGYNRGTAHIVPATREKKRRAAQAQGLPGLAPLGAIRTAQAAHDRLV